MQANDVARKVLIVDDEATNIRILLEIIEDHNGEFYLNTSYTEGAELIIKPPVT